MNEPSSFRAKVPFSGPSTNRAFKASPSKSVSFARTPSATITSSGVSSIAVKVSATATGASLTAATLTVTSLLTAVPESDVSTVRVMSPLMLFPGLNFIPFRAVLIAADVPVNFM